MKQPLLKFTGRHPESLRVVDMEFYSLKQAKFYNPHLIEVKQVLRVYSFIKVLPTFINKIADTFEKAV